MMPNNIMTVVEAKERMRETLESIEKSRILRNEAMLVREAQRMINYSFSSYVDEIDQVKAFNESYEICSVKWLPKWLQRDIRIKAYAQFKAGIEYQKEIDNDK
jgi:hypothetical protein